MTSFSDELHRKKRRKLDDSTSTSSANQHRLQSNANQYRWRTSAEHQSYSTKLIDALRQVHRRRNNSTPVSGSREVRDAADKVLAIAAKGRTRWSRAILTNRVKLRLKYHKKAKTRSKIPPPPPPLPRAASERSKPPAPIEKRVKVLSQLVPGCRKVSFPNLLEETTDYIAALQMQVRTMTALAQLLSGSSAGSMDIEPASSNDNPVH